jgi:hypothetical protein
MDIEDEREFRRGFDRHPPTTLSRVSGQLGRPTLPRRGYTCAATR